MKKFLFCLMLCFMTIALASCASTKKSVRQLTEIKTVSVVSFALNDWGDFSAVRVGGDSASGGFGSSMETQKNTIQKSTNALLDYTEKKLGEIWKVKKADSFVGNKKYRALTVEKTLDAYVPIIKKKPLGVFTQVSMEMKRVQLKPKQAIQLCKTLGVDAVVVVFSEWTTKQGGIVPIMKPLSKNLVSVWDKNGQKVFMKRVDKLGTKVIGGMGAKVSIGLPAVAKDFELTYKRALDQMLK